MIVQMSKYAFLVYHREYDDFLLKLRDLGVVHIKGNNSMDNNAEAQTILQKRKRIDDTLKVLKAINEEKKDVTLSEGRSITQEEGMRLLDTIDELLQKKKDLESKLSSAEKDLDTFNLIWGNFSYALLDKIREAGYTIRFYSCPAGEYKEEWEEKYDIIPITTVQSITYFILVSHQGEAVELAVEQAKLPEHDVQTLNREQEQLSAELRQIEEALGNIAREQYNSLIEVDKQLQDQYNFSNAKTQTTVELDNKLMLLEGWVPTQMSADMEQALDKEGYFFRKLEIEDNDQVPIKLHNNSFSKLYEPICRIFSLPNYNEFDPTPFFAPFFMLFFGMCFADAGYGLLVLIGCTLLKRKVNPDYKPYLTLFQYLGTSAFIIGALSGSLFGIELIKVPLFASVKDYFLTSDNLMTISLVLGIVHILFGKIVAALKKTSQRGIKYGIAPFAWIFVITFGILAFGLPLLNIQLSDTIKNILLGIAGLSLLPALLYNSPGKNIFLNLGSGLWNMYNIASGLLGDTLSYIRLFALGLTGAILGNVFNSLALTMTAEMSLIPKIVLMTFILLFGHSLNFGLCMISSLVHPLRLVFVEYYKNSEFEGGGKAYEPFKKA